MADRADDPEGESGAAGVEPGGGREKAKDLGEENPGGAAAAERVERRRGRLRADLAEQVTDDDDGELLPDQPVALAITDSLDLHSFQPRDIRELVPDYLDAAIDAGLKELLIIHGRGAGVQREAVRKLLAADPRVESFGDVPERAGGATWLRLRAR